MKPFLFDQLVEFSTSLVQQENKMLPLCAAENIVSPFSKIPLDTFLQEKYIMGGTISYQDNNNFIGSKKLFQLYNLLNLQCKKLFGCQYSDARTLSGVNAVTTLLMSLFSSGDTIFISSEECGGHGSMPKICHRLGIRTIELPYDFNNYDFDYEKANKILENTEIQGILICLSDMISMPKLYKFKIPDNCILIFDATQLLGLIAAKTIENPLEWFTDKQNFILMGATHKTLPGPTCGLIMTNNMQLAKRFDTLINPDYLRNNQLHHIFSLILSLMELEVYGKEYSQLIVNNANILGFHLNKNKFNVLGFRNVYTYTHQIFISMDISEAKPFVEKCTAYGVSLNLRNKSLYCPCGLRLGTQEISRYGWGEKEMVYIAGIFKNIRDSNEHLPDIQRKINQLSENKRIHFTFEKEYYDILYNSLHNR